MSDMIQAQLKEAVLRTLAYGDIFHYPLTIEEVLRYLIETPASAAAIEATLCELVTTDEITHIGEYYCLPGQEATISVRQSRAANARQLWPQAIHYGNLIGNLPFVKMVALTGSLAVDNVDENGDIDYMIVTEPGHLWTARMIIVALVKWVKRQGIVLCPNYLISERALYIEEHNLFTAREISQMIPITGLKTYQHFRAVNSWTNTFFPNAADPPLVESITQKQATQGASSKLIETLLRTPPGNWLDEWEMQRKINKFAQQNPGAVEADFTRDWCKGHFEGHMIRVLNAYQTRTDQLFPQQTRKPQLTDTEQHTDMQPEKLLFGQSYYLRFDQKLWDAMQPYPPLGTLYAAGYMRERGYDVALFDAMLADSEQEWAQALDTEQPEYAIIYEDNFNYLSKMCLTRMREAAFTMTQMAKDRGCTVIIAGSDATDHYTTYLQHGADYVLIGEGEETLSDLLDALTGRTDTPIHTITGVVSDHNLYPTRRKVMKHLDELPRPAWDLIDVERYKTIWHERHGYFSMNMVTTRGCPYHCNWCAKPIWGQRYNVHSPERVAADLQWLKEQYQPDHIWFADDIMGLKPGWLERFAEIVDEAGTRTPFKCLSRADLLLRGDTINALQRAGCDIVWIGAESGSQKVLDAMEKGTRVEQIREAAAQIHQIDMRIGFFLQFGYPGETRTDITATLQLVRDAQPDDIGISVSYPLPGTQFHQRVKAQLGTQHNWQDSSDLAMLYEGPFTTEFYRQLHTVIHKEFRSRKTLSKINHIIRRQRDKGRVILRDVAAMVYHTATLPLSRFRLNHLARQAPTNGITLGDNMDYTAAATPSPQGDD